MHIATKGGSQEYHGCIKRSRKVTLPMTSRSSHAKLIAYPGAPHGITVATRINSMLTCLHSSTSDLDHRRLLVAAVSPPPKIPGDEDIAATNDLTLNLAE
jgi:hypothetical protein